jgi:hypothetical protein
MEHKNLLNPYTANSKQRACTRKALTKDKVNALNTKMAVHCDKVLAKDRVKEELHEKRKGFKEQRLAKKG